MSERAGAGLARLRRIQTAGWASLFGLFTCFLILVASESRIPDQVWAVKTALLVCIAVHLGAVGYLRRQRCPACGHKFVGSTRSVVGSFTALSQRQCQHCGAGAQRDRS
jgi:hypothetical protein